MKQLKQLFELQYFKQNKRLAELIRDTEERYDSQLLDEELELVNAAGVVSHKPEKVYERIGGINKKD